MPEYEEVLGIIHHESDAFRSRVTGQRQAHRACFLRTKRDTRDDATIHAETLERINIEWTSLERRLRIVPGKDMLAALNRTLLDRFGQSVTEALVCSNFAAPECDPDLYNLLRKLDMFCASGAERASQV